MSKVITEANGLFMKRSVTSGNLVAVFSIDNVQYRSATGEKNLPAGYDKKISVATDENDELIVSPFTTKNGTVQKMVPFEGFDCITQRGLLTHAAEVAYKGNLSF